MICRLFSSTHRNLGNAGTIEILVLEDACGKKGRFFQLVTNLFWVVHKEVLLSPVKCSIVVNYLVLVGDQQTFYKDCFDKNVCWTRANILILVLRFLWPERI
jgi:hypothetical protein